MTAKEHNKLVGIFLMIHGALQVFGMIIAIIVMSVLGTSILANSQRREEQFAGTFFLFLTIFIVVFACLILLPQIIGGYKLLKEQANARTWGIIGSILSCLSFPLGTAAGVYGLWFLFGEEGKRFYLADGQQQFLNTPPQNWR